MSKRKQEKRKARAKEKAKQHRRERGASPLSKILGEETMRCWMEFTQEHESKGLRNIVVTRGMRGTPEAATAIFLIDYDCLGLKDAFVRFDMTASEVRQTFDAGGQKLETISVEKVRGYVAAAIRWTRAHPFHLPAESERALKILGGTLNVENAPVVEFGTDDGGLHYIGRERDLAKALKGMTLDEFVDREDVECTFMEAEDFGEEDFDAEDEDAFDEDEEYADDSSAMDPRTVKLLERTSEKLESKLTEWCGKTGRTPALESTRACKLVAGVNLMAVGRLQSGEVVEAPGTMVADEIMEIVENQPDELRGTLEDAVSQLMDYIGSDANWLETVIVAAAAEIEKEDKDSPEGRKEDPMEVITRITSTIQEGLMDRLRRWSFATARILEEKMPEAARVIVMAMLSMDEDLPDEEAFLQARGECLQVLLEKTEPGASEPIQRAYDQVMEYVNSLDSLEELLDLLESDE